MDQELNELLAQGGVIEIAPDRTRRRHAAVAGQVLLPGAFNPVHDGHWKLAQAGQALLGRNVAFELSLANVDKPDLTCDEVRCRVEQFHGKAAMWITRAPTFVLKAQVFPQATFVVGVDTAVRILQARYYAPGEDSVAQALNFLRERGCCFLVGCRADAGQQIVRLDDLSIPAEYRGLFTEISPMDFRMDVSSTDLRRQKGSVK